MTTIDTARLRALAEAAHADVAPEGSRDPKAWAAHLRAVGAFQKAVDPPTVLALLDEIERLRGEGEWEYAWAGEGWLLADEVFPSPQVAENWVGLLSTRRWVREEGGHLVRRHPATEWERVEGDDDA